jgi:predicted dienelactone hydrolase
VAVSIRWLCQILVAYPQVRGANDHLPLRNHGFNAGLMNWDSISDGFWARSVHRLGMLTAGFLVMLLTAKSAPAAETIRITQGILSLSIPVDALEQFAATGEVPPELNKTLGRLNASTLERFRYRLTDSVDADVIAVSQLANSYLGDDFLTRFGNIVRTGTGQNGGLATRAALVAAAQDPEGITLMGLIRHFPTNIQVEARDLRYLNRQAATFFDYKLAALGAIQQQAEIEMAERPIDFNQMADLRQPGSFSVSRQTLTLIDPNRPAPNADGPRTFDVDLYVPQTQSPAPVVMISHGWGADKASFEFLGLHLASHGFVVAVPQHVGSDAAFQQRFLAGVFYEDIPPREYVDRPLDISYTLDELERLTSADGAYHGRFDLTRVGMIGHSLGGYTALALAGAPLNYNLLQRACVPERPFAMNLSIYLQCRAAPLPPVDKPLRDDRVDAAMALNPITSVVQGPSQLAKITVPTMLVTGNLDLLAPPVQEQIHPFTWLTTSDKYLVAMVPADHGSAVQGEPDDNALYGGLAPETTVASSYTQALATAFMKVYGAGDTSFAPYLSAAYAGYINQPEIAISLIQSLTPDQLEAAYGGPSPFPLRPGDLSR